MNKNNIQKLSISALLLAIGLFLPFLTGQIPAIGSMLLPMHIPVLLCGFICGWKYGFALGFILPLFRSFLYGMPPIYPVAISMAFEMATYGSVSGHLFFKSSLKGLYEIYYALINAMIAGRVIWGLSQLTLLNIKGTGFTLSAFLAGAFVNAIPGIIIQLILIPLIITALSGAKLLKFRNTGI